MQYKWCDTFRQWRRNYYDELAFFRCNFIQWPCKLKFNRISTWANCVCVHETLLNALLHQSLFKQPTKNDKSLHQWIFNWAFNAINSSNDFFSSFHSHMWFPTWRVIGICFFLFIPNTWNILAKYKLHTIYSMWFLHFLFEFLIDVMPIQSKSNKSLRKLLDQKVNWLMNIRLNH